MYQHIHKYYTHIHIYAFINTHTRTHIYLYTYIHIGAFLVVQVVKNITEMQETQVCSLGWEDPLEKGMVTHSSTSAWRIPGIEEPGKL